MKIKATTKAGGAKRGKKAVTKDLPAGKASEVKGGAQAAVQKRWLPSNFRLP